jgi:hypothetical protein
MSYREEIESKYISLAWKLGLHPSTLAHLSSITSNCKKDVPMLGVLREYVPGTVSG